MEIVLDLKIVYVNGGYKVKYSDDLKYETYSWLFQNLIQDNDYKTSPHIKKLTTSGLKFNNYKNVKNGILIKPNVTNMAFLISTSDEQIYNKILKNINKQKIYQISNINFKINNIKTRNDILNVDCCLFNTIQPIVIAVKRNDKKYFLTPNDQTYITHFKNNIVKRLDGRLTSDNIIVEILNDSVKTKMDILKNNKIISASYKFLIKINHPDSIEMMNELFLGGFGSKTAFGFGLVEIIKS